MNASFFEKNIELSFELKAGFLLLKQLFIERKGRIKDDARWIAGMLGLSVRKWNMIKKSLLDLNKIKLENQQIFLNEENKKGQTNISTNTEFKQKLSQDKIEINKQKCLKNKRLEIKDDLEKPRITQNKHRIQKSISPFSPLPPYPSKFISIPPCPLRDIPPFILPVLEKEIPFESQINPIPDLKPVKIRASPCLDLSSQPPPYPSTPLLSQNRSPEKLEIQEKSNLTINSELNPINDQSKPHQTSVIGRKPSMVEPFMKGSRFKREDHKKPSHSVRKRGKRLAENWSPCETELQIARQFGWSEAKIEIEAKRFRNYWTSLTGRKAIRRNWSRVWQNWVTSPYANSSYSQPFSIKHGGKNINETEQGKWKHCLLSEPNQANFKTNPAPHSRKIGAHAQFFAAAYEAALEQEENNHHKTTHPKRKTNP